ncbi:MAG: metallophosphoesterase [Deltaproteobacteria bacterium]|jgi:predicted MPP superfamily phosphohydrolase|nr:metallophosphoesterase [Deltaproteobacteria bacterium]
MFRSYALVILVFLFITQIVAWRLWRRRFEKPLGRKIINIIFVAFNVGWLASLYQWRLGDNGMSGYFLAWVARPAISWQASHAFIILPLAALASILAWIPLRLAKKNPKPSSAPQANLEKLPAQTPAEEPKNMDRRQFLKTATNASFFGLVGLCSYGVYRQYRFPEVKRLTINIPDLPKALDGLTIAQLSDTHMGLWTTERELDAAMFTAKAEKPDLVVFTGDLVDRDPSKAELYGAPLKRHLQDIPLGVYGILGNHDHFTNPNRIAKILDARGINMLVDERYNFSDLPLSLVGLDDRRGRMFPGAQSAHNDPDLLDFSPVKGPQPREGDFRILLNHRPEGISQAVRAGYQLYLAGHTHGGQYSWPGSDHQANLASLFYKYTAGLYQVDSGWLNVSCGLAAVGVPFRLVSWPEISLITLKRA